MYKTPEAPVIGYQAPTRHRPAATVTVACPHCRQLDRRRRPTEIPGRHVHGLGRAGQRPDLGSRVAHCGAGWPQGNGYTITDPDSLVPDVLDEIEPALSLTGAGLDEAWRRRPGVQPARNLPWGRSTGVAK